MKHYLLFFVCLFLFNISSTLGQVTYYSKVTATDFNDINSWGSNSDGTGTLPSTISNADYFVIQNNSNLSISANISVGKLTITSGNLTIGSNQLDISIVGQNKSTLLISGGTLSVSNTGSIILNGNFLMTSGGFTQSGGSIKIDPNNNNNSINSISSTISAFSITGGTINCSAGKIIIVDPPVNTFGVQSTRSISISTTTNLNAFTGTHTFELGDGVSTTTGNTDGFSIETNGSGRVPLQNVTINGSSIAGRWTSSSFNNTATFGTLIKGVLTINATSEFRVSQNATIANELMIGSIVNNGIFTTGRTTASPILFLGTHPNLSSYIPTITNISGTGIFRNLTTSQTAFFNNLTFNNINGIIFDTGSLNLGTLQGHVSGTLNFINGIVNTNNQEFRLGISISALGALSHTAGGFSSNSTFGRWFAATTTGTTINAATSPTIGAGSYPFLSGTNIRNFHLNRPSTTGATGGVIKVTHIDGNGFVPISQTLDGTYLIEKQSNASWIVGIASTFAAGTGTFSYAIHGQGIFNPYTNNARLTKGNSVTGTHQTGTLLPLVQRINISATNFLGTFNLGVSSTDVPNLVSVQSGAWNDPSTWGGTVPNCSTSCLITSGHTVSVTTSAADTCASLMVVSGGNLSVIGGNLTIGCLTNNATFTNNGIFSINNGSLTVNGNINCNTGSTFSQTGGEISINGNSGIVSSSVITGLPLINFSSNNLTLNGGFLTILNPHAGNGVETAINYTPTTSPYPIISTSHTTTFGNGSYTINGGSSSGFRISQGTRLILGNLNVNTLSTTPIYSSGIFSILGNLTISNGEFQIVASNTNVIGGNILNNGILTNLGILYLGNYTLPSTTIASTIPQSIGGNGVFRNSTSTPTASFFSLTINNTSNTGITLLNSYSISNVMTMISGLINVNANNSLTLGTNTVQGSLVGTPSNTNMVKGNFIKTFAANSIATTTLNLTHLFPVGEGNSYLPIWFSPNTSSSGASSIGVKAFNSNTGTFGTGVTSIENVRWEITNSAPNLLSAYIRTNLSNITSTKTFVQAATANGSYDTTPGVSTVVNGTDLTTSLIPVSSLTGYLSYGENISCSIPTQPTNIVETNVTTNSISATFSPSSSNPTGYLIVRFVNGNTITHPSNYKNYTIGEAIGSGVVISTGSSIAINQTGLSSGISYIFYVYPYNFGTCAGPVYNTTAPLFKTISTCASSISAPTIAQTNFIMPTSVQLNWTASTAVGVSDYLVDVYTDAALTNQVIGYPKTVGSSATSFVATGLSPSTQYYYRIQTLVGSFCKSPFTSTQTVTTACATYNIFPFVESFNSFLPSCWTSNNSGTPQTGPIGTSSGSWAADGFLNNGLTGSAKINIYSNIISSWLISPHFDLSGNNYVLKYKVGLTAFGTTGVGTLGSDDEIHVLASNNGGISWSSIKVYNNTIPLSNFGKTEYINLSAFNSNNVKIAFWASSGSISNSGFDNDFFIDEVTVEPLENCYAPSILNANSFKPTNVSFTVAPHPIASGLTDYSWEVRSSGSGGSGALGLADSGTSTSTTVTSNINILTPNTSYNIYIKANCGNGFSSNWAGPLNVTTLCSLVTTFPWSENFDGLNSSGNTIFPNCWIKQNGDWTSADSSSNVVNNPRSGNYYLVNSSTATNEWIWTPAFELIADREYYFKFWYVGDGLSGWTGTVGVNNNPTSTGASNLFTFISSATTSSINYNQNQTYFKAPSSGVYYFGINIGATSIPQFLGFDDFTVEEIPPCRTPNLPTITALKSTGVTFSAAPVIGGVSVLDYNWEIRTTGNGGSGNNGLVLSGTSSTTTVSIATGLTPNTQYSIYIKANCGSTHNGAWAGPTVFTTACSNISSFPWYEDFENLNPIGVDMFPTCWKKENGNWETSTGASNNLNLPRLGTKYLVNYATADIRTITLPGFELTAGKAYNLKFWFAGDGRNGWTGNVYYKYFNSINNTILGTSFITSTITSSINYQEVVRSFTPTTSGLYYFTIQVSNNTEPFVMGFDDFSLEIGTNCTIPTFLSLNNQTAYDIGLSWSAATNIDWEIRTWGSPGSGANGLIKSGTFLGSIFSSIGGGLTPGTKYFAYVRQNCFNGVKSLWTQPTSFTTLCAPIVTLPWKEDFEALNSSGSTTFPNCWLKQNGNWQTAVDKTQIYNDPRSGLYYLTNNSNASNDWIWSPSFQLTAGKTYKFSFWVAGDAGSGWTGEVGFNNAQTSTGVTILGLPFLQPTATIPSSYQEVIRVIKPTLSGNYTFGIKASANMAQSIGFDDFKLEELPNCTNHPISATISTSNTNVCSLSNVILNATNLNINGGNSYQWQQSLNGGISWSNIQTPVSGVSTTSITISSLTLTSNYRLLGVCSAVTSTSTGTYSNNINLNVVSSPAVSTTIATSNYVCSSNYLSNTILSLDGATSGANYDWQTSIDGINYYSIGTNSNTISPIINTSKYYRCALSCNSNISYSIPININIRPASQCYCVPPTHLMTTSCLTNVTLNTINNSPQNQCSSSYSKQNATTTLLRGETYTLSVTANDSSIISFWLDYNQNGQFETTEWTQVAVVSPANSQSNVNILIPTSALLGTTGMRIRTRYKGNENSATDACSQFYSGECQDFYITIADQTGTRLSLKTYLSNFSTGTSLMNDSQRFLPDFPLNDPYATATFNNSFTHVNNSNQGSLSQNILNNIGNNAIIDWVFLELRNGTSGSTSVQYTKSALLQADGDMVDLDGISPVAFPNTISGNYFIAVRHRNHLGFRTSNPIAISYNTPLLDFTDGTISLYGATPLYYNGNQFNMISGDANADGSIDAFDTIIWENQNGLFDNYNNNSDYNLDGSIDAFDSIIWELNNGKFQELD